MSKVYFNPAILEKAKQLFYAVYNDGDCVRIYRTDWEYSEEEVFHNNADLEKYVNDEIADRVYFYQHEMNYSESEAEKYALMY